MNNKEVNKAQDSDAVMPMYNFLEYSDNCSKTRGILFQYYRAEPNLKDDGAIVDFGDNNITDLFKFKRKITSQTGKDGTKNVEIMVPLNYLSIFLSTLE